MDAKTIARFWSKVNKDGPVPPHRPELGPCWVWTGAKSTGHDGGYGHFKYLGRAEKSHRVSFLMATGHWPTPCGLHRCDTRACCRPDHIFQGTDADNSADMIAKHRSAHVRGEAVSLAKLSASDVGWVRQQFGVISVAVMAATFGVTRQCIWAILKRRTWRHVA